MGDRPFQVTGIQTVLLYVADVDRSKRFYEERLGLTKVYEHGPIVAYQLGETRILLHPTADDGEVPGGRVHLYLGVHDVDAAHAHLAAQGVETVQEPTDRDWGERDAAVVDPDGLHVYLTQSMPGTWLGEPN